jgi:hypothetical protein
MNTKIEVKIIVSDNNYPHLLWVRELIQAGALSCAPQAGTVPELLSSEQMANFAKNTLAGSLRWAEML